MELKTDSFKTYSENLLILNASFEIRKIHNLEAQYCLRPSKHLFLKIQKLREEWIRKYRYKPMKDTNK